MLSAPSLAAVIGLFCFSVLAYSFTELSTWTDSFRHTMVIIGAFTLAAGSEIGTYAAVKEIFRRSRGGRISKTDIGALFISGLATAAALFLSIAALMGARGGWPDWVVQYGPIGVIICTALDAYAGMMESGLYESTYDARYEEWQEKYHRWCAGVSAQLGYSQTPVAPASPAEMPVAPPTIEEVVEQIAPRRGMPASLAAEVMARDGYQCYYCHSDLHDLPRDEVHIDHFYPHVHGGPASIFNLVTSCPTCNISKGARHPSTEETRQFRLHLVKTSPLSAKEKVWTAAALGLITTQASLARQLQTSEGYVSSSLKTMPDPLSKELTLLCKGIGFVGTERIALREALSLQCAEDVLQDKQHVVDMLENIDRILCTKDSSSPE